MDNYRELVGILKYLLTQRFAPMPHFIRGLLGDGAGNVLVPNRPDYNYARFNRSSGEVFEVFNKEVSQPVDGWPILIGEFPWQPGLTQVVGTDWSAYAQTGWGDSVASVQSHAPTHEWPNFSPGSDYLSIYMRAISPLRGRSGGTGTLNFYVNEYEYDFTGTNVQWPGTSPLALAAASPATGTMRYMGVYLNPATNALGAVTGTTTTFAETGEPSRPNWPLNVFPVAYARLYGGQAYFVEQDIRDARRIFDTTLMFTGTSAGGGSGGWPFDNVRTVSATDTNADHATLAAALAAASAGDVILLDAETITLTANLDVNKAVTIIGHPGGSIVNTSTNSLTLITLSTAGAQLRNLKITNSGAGLGGAGVFWTASNCVIEDCIIEVTGGGTNNYGIGPSGAVTARVVNTFITVSGGTNNYGFAAVVGNSATEIYGGKISASTYDIYGTVAGASVALYDVNLVNNSQSFSGTVSGHLHTVAYTSANPIIQNPNALSDSTFVGDIATLPGGAVLTYNVTSGDEGWLDANSTSDLAKLRLFNSTRGTYALISDTVIATNTITLTANVPAGWATTDAITIRSQTNIDTASGAYFLEYEITSTEVPTSARFILCYVQFLDVGAVASIYFHPYEAFALSKAVYCPSLNTGAYTSTFVICPLVGRRFTLRCEASGAGTAIVNVYLAGYGLP